MYAKKIYPTYFSKHNSNGENGQGWNYIAVKKLPTSLRRITSKHHGHFYCLNFLHSFRTENKLESHRKVCENKDFCNIVMPSEDI